MTVHELKTHPTPYQAVVANAKRFEYRKNDRNFQLWDTLKLQEWVPKESHPDGGFFTGEVILRWVTYIAHGPAFGIPEDYCVMSIAEQP